MRYLLYLFVFGSAQFAFNQEFSAIILDGFDNPLQEAKILNINNNEKRISNNNGYFSILVSPLDSLEIRPRNTRSFIYVVPEKIERSLNGNEIVFINSDFEDYKLLEEFTITSERVKNVVSRHNANVLDYHLFKNGRVLSLTSFRNKYFLNIEFKDQVIQEYQIDMNKPKVIFQDPLNNFHIKGKDSAAQIMLSDELIFVDTYPANFFEKYIQLLLDITDEKIVWQHFSNHNQAFRLIERSKTNSIDSVLHTIIDLPALIQANEFYNAIIATYNSTVSIEKNIIKNGIWSGKIDHSLAENPELISMITWYNNVIARKINVFAFRSNKNFLIIDLDNKKVKQFNNNGMLDKEININTSSNLNNHKVLFDSIANKIYTYNEKEPHIRLMEIGLNNGQVTEQLILNETKYRFPENLKVFNGWLYFTKINDAQFRKLYRIKIK